MFLCYGVQSKGGLNAGTVAVMLSAPQDRHLCRRDLFPGPGVLRKRMNTRLISTPIDLLHATVIAALLLLVLPHLPAGYQSYKIRQRVMAGLLQADPAKELVIANALNGNNHAQGWTDSAAGAHVGISIQPHSGIITIIYPADIDGANKTLVLIPMYMRENRVSPLADEVYSHTPMDAANILWTCTSSLTLSRTTFIADNLGTLQSKYAPTACRFSYR